MIASQDREGLSLLLHSLKGVAGNIGAMSLSAMAEAGLSTLKNEEAALESRLPISEALASLLAEIGEVLRQAAAD